MSIDLLHRINASEQRFRRGENIIGEFVVDETPDEEVEMEIRKHGDARFNHGGPLIIYYAYDNDGDFQPVCDYASYFIDRFKEP